VTIFAKQLSDKITSNPIFWCDLEAACNKAAGYFFPGVVLVKRDDYDEGKSLNRLIRSASILSQSNIDSDRGLAQDVALYVAIASDDISVKVFACEIIESMGNHPGAEMLRGYLKTPTQDFSSFLRTSILRGLNTVKIKDVPYAFTDFQHDLWTALPMAKASAVSAPTSAGKSFVVIEHLCAEAVSKPDFSAVFIAPTRALLAEIHFKISNRLSEYASSIRVSVIPTLDAESKNKQIWVLTQERLQVLLAIWSGAPNLVIIDESQAIGDDSRGMILQDCLEIIRARSTSTRFLFLAPGAVGFSSMSEAIGLPEIFVEKTELSPVVQNRIIAEHSPGDENSLILTLLSGARKIQLGRLTAERGFGNAKTRLAAVALELGNQGGSLVYGTGPADAEDVSAQIATGLASAGKPKLIELSKFIKKHVHAQYSLGQHVLKGVGYHYGKMPSLLRESIEEAFKDGHLKYLACTTTLFQGVNLPARHVFIDTPTRGNKGEELDPAAMWNFAGRAGRLGKDIIGNVFLVGYDKWESQPLSERVSYKITPSFKKAVVNNYESVLSNLRGVAQEDKTSSKGLAEHAAGLLIARAARGSLESFVDRTLSVGVIDAQRQELIAEARSALDKLKLPSEALITNWTVSPFGQSRLLDRFRQKIKEGKVDDLIPVQPYPWTRNVYSRYVGIFGRINKQVFGKSASPKFNNMLASVGLAWMNGERLPVIISKRIKYLKADRESVNIDSAIRGVFDFIEDTLRFKYVQLGRAYIDLLRFALKEADLEEKSKLIYDFPMALELGVSSIAGQSFIELGLSRITSAALEALIPDSNPSVDKAREWLRGLTLVESKLSIIIWNELIRKNLVNDVDSTISTEPELDIE